MFSALRKKPRKPILQIPVSHTVGWWSYQHNVTIRNFLVTVVESNLSLVNDKTLIGYTINGSLQYKAGHKPFVQKIHISEEVVVASFLEEGIMPRAILKFTPVVAVEEDKKYNGEVIVFEIHNEHLVQSLGWGPNSIQFECGSLKSELILQQSK